MNKQTLDKIISTVKDNHSTIKKLDGITVNDKPDAPKEGYVLKPVISDDGKAIAWEYVVDPDYVRPSGSYTNPTDWTAGMAITAGVNADYVSDGWYVYDGLVQRCIKDGSPDTFTDTEYWEVIG